MLWLPFLSILLPAAYIYLIASCTFLLEYLAQFAAATNKLKFCFWSLYVVDAATIVSRGMWHGKVLVLCRMSRKGACFRMPADDGCWVVVVMYASVLWLHQLASWSHEPVQLHSATQDVAGRLCRHVQQGLLRLLGLTLSILQQQ